jgi:hypothetical protein
MNGTTGKSNKIKPAATTLFFAPDSFQILHGVLMPFLPFLGSGANFLQSQPRNQKLNIFGSQ